MGEVYLIVIGLAVWLIWAYIVSSDHERKMQKRQLNGCLFLVAVGLFFWFLVSA